jgi:2'-deoxynucleoside 5'-phosphate N-hydrolase
MDNIYSMKIYFAGSIRGGRPVASLYPFIIQHLSIYGEVLTEHVADVNLTSAGEDGPDDHFIYERDMEWLRSSDRVVAEVSIPSLGVGYEIGYAVSLKKPVLCLYQPGADRRLSAMIGGSPGVETAIYASMDELRARIDHFLEEPPRLPSE